MYKTEQETFGQGKFGDEYVKRNSSQDIIASNINLFPKYFSGYRGDSECHRIRCKYRFEF